MIRLVQEVRNKMERLTEYMGNGENYESINPIDTPYEYGKADTILAMVQELEQYRAIGTLEELKAAMKYVYLAKKHGTVGQVIENCVKYEEIGTPEECLQNKDFLDFLTDKMNPNDFETYFRIYNAQEEKGCEQ